MTNKASIPDMDMDVTKISIGTGCSTVERIGAKA